MTLVITERDTLNQERELWLSPENVVYVFPVVALLNAFL